MQNPDGTIEWNDAQVIEIKRSSRYVIQSRESLSMDDWDKLRHYLKQWQESGEQFLILGPGLELKMIVE